MLRIAFAALLIFCSPRTSAQVSPLRTGKHSLTLQWISWDKPGSVQVTKTKLGYHIAGRQRSPNGRDSLRIDGLLAVVSPKELRFQGKIITAIHHIAQGAPCVRDGDYTFLSTGKRRYWRLQQMLNCDGAVTDYVDIYF